MAQETADIGLIGMAVMGQNLILNMNDNGYTVCAFNRTVSKVDDFLQGAAKGTKVIGAHNVDEFVGSLKKPRVIMMMIKAGDAVDQQIEELLPHLEEGDIIIDGGNSHYPDTNRRCKELDQKGILFMGCGVSGGEEGARHGPSIMPGGNEKAWERVKPILQAISAKVDGEPCCDWVGKDGAGHYVKMVHNGIEYGDEQIICEVYDFMKNAMGLSNDEMSTIFGEWNKGELDSYLIEITTDILKYKSEDGNYLVDEILDVAGQKGTGKWTAISSLDQGIPLPLISEAVFARCLSALKSERIKVSSMYKKERLPFQEDKQATIDKLRKATYLAKVISYAQGYMLMRSASDEFGWNLNYGGIALMWRGGCIIRSKFLGKIREAYKKNPNLENLLLDDFFKDIVHEGIDDLRDIACSGARYGIPMPCISSALNFYDGLAREQLPANLLQSMRDYFGAHTYQTLKEFNANPTGQIPFHHTNWTGKGGTTSSSSYNA
ncbi:MAG: 6-phosphogluconate dehydrogenase, decarboxylating [Chlamydiia bacterium]|nr:6-phosphogluconate dehydrogenase, decarboxylating [Chlamydiia bacterium]